MLKTLEKYSDGRIVYLHDCIRCGKEDSARGTISKRTAMCPSCLHSIRRDSVISSGRLNQYKHGMKTSNVMDYRRWQAIKARCFNKNNPAYKHYGGRGITMQESWIDDAKSFIEYIGNLDGHGEHGLSIDRIDNDGDYCEGNLRWASKVVQMNNQRNKKTNSGYDKISIEINSSGNKYFVFAISKLTPKRKRFKELNDALKYRMEIYGF